jgi:uncharacterized protein (TIGR03067 family)
MTHPDTREPALTRRDFLAGMSAAVPTLAAGRPHPLSDRERLQGVWKVSRAEFGGKPSCGMGLQLTFATGRVEYQTSMVLREGTCRLNPAASPRRLDIKTDAWLMRAIYRFDGDTLLVAGGNPAWDTQRPKDFAAARRKQFVWTMQRLEVNKQPADEGTIKEDRMKRARLRCGARLETLVRAMHRYIDDHGCFPPPALTASTGKPLLSWRVALLPYLDEKDLYDQFHLDEPWNSARNRPLLARMPKAYASVGSPPRGAHGTFFQVFVGEGCLFEPGTRVGFEDVHNGTGQTIAVIAAAQAVPWTRPADLAYAAGRPLPSFAGGMIDDGLISFAAVDSAVHVIPNAFDKAKERLLRAAITRNSGELVRFADLDGSPGLFVGW